MNSSQQHTANSVSQGAQKTADCIDSVARQGAAAAKKAGNDLSQYAETFVGSAQEMAQAAQERASDAMERAKEEGKRRMQQVEREVKDAPLAAVGLAFLGGLVVASLLKR